MLVAGAGGGLVGCDGISYSDESRQTEAGGQGWRIGALLSRCGTTRSVTVSLGVLLKDGETAERNQI